MGWELDSSESKIDSQVEVGGKSAFYNWFFQSSMQISDVNVLGLGVAANRIPFDDSFIDQGYSCQGKAYVKQLPFVLQLYKNESNSIERAMFSFGSNGLIIGEEDSRLRQTDLTFGPSRHDQWSLRCNATTFFEGWWTSSGIGMESNLYFQSRSKYILFPSLYYDEFLYGASRVGITVDEAGQISGFSDDQLNEIALTFYIGRFPKPKLQTKGGAYPLTLGDLLEVRSDGKYQLLVKPYDEADEKAKHNIITLGLPFFREYYTVFEYTKPDEQDIEHMDPQVGLALATGASIAKNVFENYNGSETKIVTI